MGGRQFPRAKMTTSISPSLAADTGDSCAAWGWCQGSPRGCVNPQEEEEDGVVGAHGDAPRFLGSDTGYHCNLELPHAEMTASPLKPCLF